MTLTLALALGLTVGILLGLLGGGGSILAVPILVYALGFPLPEAIPTSLLVIGVASAVGVISKVRARLIEWRLAAIFAATGVLGTLAGTALGKHLPETAVMIGFAIVMILAGHACCAAPTIPEPPAGRAIPGSTGADAHLGPYRPDSASVSLPDCSASAGAS